MRKAFPTWKQADKDFTRRKFKGSLRRDVSQWGTPLASAFFQWAQRGSWSMCTQCKRLEKRDFEPRDIAAANFREPTASRFRGRSASQRSAWIAKCKHCATGAGYPAVSINAIPLPLRELTEEALEALRPVEVDVGAYVRARFGYRVHTEMIHFRWKGESVDVAIGKLRGRHRRKANAAWNHLIEAGAYDFSSWTTLQDHFLVNPSESAYSAVEHMHQRFLRRNSRDLSANKRRLPLRFMETVGLESAVWPHLYPRVDLCETFVRKQDSRRKASTALAKRQARYREWAHEEEQQEDEDEYDIDQAGDDEKQHHSLKRSYLDKVSSPVIGRGGLTICKFSHPTSSRTQTGLRAQASGQCHCREPPGRQEAFRRAPPGRQVAVFPRSASSVRCPVLTGGDLLTGRWQPKSP